MMPISAVGKGDKLDPRQFQQLQEALVEDARKVIRMRTNVWAVEREPDWVQEIAFDKLVDMSPPTIGGKLGSTPFDTVDAGTRVTQLFGYIRKGFRIWVKDLAASRQLGRALDDANARDIARQMAELENKTLINGDAVAGEGLLNAAGRNTITGTDWDTTGDPYDDIRKAIAALKVDNFFGPYQVVVSPTQNSNLLKARTAADKTHLEMIKAMLTDIGSIVEDSQMVDTSAIVCEGRTPANFRMAVSPDFVFQPPEERGEWTLMRAWVGIATQVKRAQSICEITAI